MKKEKFIHTHPIGSLRFFNGIKQTKNIAVNVGKMVLPKYLHSNQNKKMAILSADILITFKSLTNPIKFLETNKLIRCVKKQSAYLMLKDSNYFNENPEILENIQPIINEDYKKTIVEGHAIVLTLYEIDLENSNLKIRELRSLEEISKYQTENPEIDVLTIYEKNISSIMNEWFEKILEDRCTQAPFKSILCTPKFFQTNEYDNICYSGFSDEKGNLCVEQHTAQNNTPFNINSSVYIEGKEQRENNKKEEKLIKFFNEENKTFFEMNYDEIYESLNLGEKILSILIDLFILNDDIEKLNGLTKNYVDGFFHYEANRFIITESIKEEAIEKIKYSS